MTRKAGDVLRDGDPRVRVVVAQWVAAAVDRLAPFPPRASSGLVEQQRIFAAAHPR